MTYLSAVREMVEKNGFDTIYSDGAVDWDGYNLVEAAEEAEAEGVEETCEYGYSSGVTGNRLGVYRLNDDGMIDSVPVVEVRSVEEDE